MRGKIQRIMNTASTPASLRANITAAVATFQTLTALEVPLTQAVELIAACLAGGGKLLLCGNGGSASDAAHLAGEFVGRFLKDRQPYPAICLNESGTTLTCIGNDFHFDQIFARQVQAFGKKGDVLLVFTSSGNSRNVLLALETAQQLGIPSIAFLGKGGGPTRGKASVELLVPGDSGGGVSGGGGGGGGSTARIQEAHTLLYHTLCEMVEQRLGHG